MIGMCLSMAQLAIQLDQARQRGVTSFEVQQMIVEQPDPRVREIARAVQRYVFDFNKDGNMSSAKVSQMVLRACEANSK